MTDRVTLDAERIVEVIGFLARAERRLRRSPNQTIQDTAHLVTIALDLLVSALREAEPSNPPTADGQR